ncbi:universal stress protein [Faecalibacter bovis]|uniref:Universal stress protein n=1 Tax=Faecalibacter bovis TaxID=2898187 RepID=A0ABX7XFZ3_9FLAO|nr:universal stress protein [Faecalibacter bovis]MBS7333120.1 universal stress protein [Weeksellaceae bacterium]QTV06831.1 universal stress protein [Faecalibacter bovis]
MATILFPTDFSKTANNAFLYALNLAKAIDADIRLITLKTHLKEYLNMHEDEFETKVNQLKAIAKENQLEDINIKSSLEIGDLLLTVLDVVNKENIDYIVMGTNGENSFGQKFFGSQTLAVINNSPVPVLAVPHNVVFEENRKFAFASMFDPKEESAINQMISFAKKHQSTLDIVHVENKNMSVDMIMNKRELEVNHPDVKVEVIKNDDVESALLDYCKMYHIDVLGIMNRELNPFQRLFTESYSKHLLTSADFAILVLKEK